ncbi:MAG: FHA domain-containing protein [Firmicutes bacterium]|nr:FHA domain-containing protein [Bacillota bacterium]
MDFFTKLEKSLGNIIETALFAKPGGTIQPIEIARALWTEITASKRAGMKETYIPNHFVVSLTSDDMEFLQPVRDSVESEILKYIDSESKKRDFRTLGPLQLKWEEDDSLKEGKFGVSLDFTGYDETQKTTESGRKYIEPPTQASSVSAPFTPVKTTPQKNIFEDSIVKPVPAVSASPVRQTCAVKLDITEGFDKGKFFRITRFPATIGRRESNDVSIGDPRVSGKHAVISEENGKIVIEDSGSKTGLFVNGKKVEKWVLQDGDEIGMGITIIKINLA